MLMRTLSMVGFVCLTLCASGIAQSARTVPRPPATSGPPRPEDGSAAPDGYAPLPAWLGQTRAPRPARPSTYEIQTVAEGLTGAFSFHFLPDGRIVVAERAGRIKIVGKDGKISEPLEGLPSTMFARGGQGLYEALPDRAFATTRTIFLSYTVLPDGANPSALPRSPGVLVVARATLSSDDRRLEGVKVLLNAEGTGGRVIQAPDGTLFVTSTIPAGVGINSVDWPQPQQFDSRMGKVLRINADGSAPADNPFAHRAGADPEIYALGFRDVQGVAIQPRSGALWTSEHGPRGGDEINLVEKGKNYGFPEVGYGREYTGKPIHGDKTSAPGMEEPIYFWTPDVAPAGIAFYAGKLFPAWQGDLFVSALVSRALVRLVLKQNHVVAEERLLTELNTRIRGVAEGPDGALYVLTDGANGKILRLVPKRERLMIDRRISRRRFSVVTGGALASLAFSDGCDARVASPGGDGRLTARPRKDVVTTPGDARRPLRLDSSRDAILQLPSKAASGPLPLLVIFHGASGADERMLQRVAPAADEAGVAVLAPDSRGGTWDAIRGDFAADVGFVDRALARVFETVSIDPDRVAAGGFSDGATYALSLGLINGDLFRRLIAFSPGFVVGGEPHGHPKVFISHGTSDPILPIDQCSRVIVPRLRQLGYDVTFKEFDGRHEVPPAIALEALKWMA